MYTWAELGTKGAGLKVALSICTLWRGREAIEAETSIARNNTYSSSIRLIEIPGRCLDERERKRAEKDRMLTSAFRTLLRNVLTGES